MTNVFGIIRRISIELFKRYICSMKFDLIFFLIRRINLTFRGRFPSLFISIFLLKSKTIRMEIFRSIEIRSTPKVSIDQGLGERTNSTSSLVSMVKRLFFFSFRLLMNFSIDFRRVSILKRLFPSFRK